MRREGYVRFLSHYMRDVEKMIDLLNIFNNSLIETCKVSCIDIHKN